MNATVPTAKQELRQIHHSVDFGINSDDLELPQGFGLMVSGGLKVLMARLEAVTNKLVEIEPTDVLGPEAYQLWRANTYEIRDGLGMGSTQKRPSESGLSKEALIDIRQRALKAKLDLEHHRVALDGRTIVADKTAAFLELTAEKKALKETLDGFIAEYEAWAKRRGVVYNARPEIVPAESLAYLDGQDAEAYAFAEEIGVALREAKKRLKTDENAKASYAGLRNSKRFRARVGEIASAAGRYGLPPTPWARPGMNPKVAEAMEHYSKKSGGAKRPMGM